MKCSFYSRDSPRLQPPIHDQSSLFTHHYFTWVKFRVGHKRAAVGVGAGVRSCHFVVLSSSVPLPKKKERNSEETTAAASNCNPDHMVSSLTGSAVSCFFLLFPVLWPLASFPWGGHTEKREGSKQPMAELYCVPGRIKATQPVVEEWSRWVGWCQESIDCWWD